MRKKHEIVDHKGYKPAICPDHENLCFLFCCDCKVVFCFECIGKHSQHGFITVSEKASEVRGAIYECMGLYDELMKPMKHRAGVVKTSLENIRQFEDSMNGDNLVKTLCEAFERVIRANEAILVERANSQKTAQKPNEKTCFSKSQIEALEFVAENADRNLLKLKNMLKMSDGVTISNYIDSKDGLESSVGDQADELKRHAYLEWTPSLPEIVMHSVINAIGLVKTPQIQNVFLNTVLLTAEEIGKIQKTVDWKTLDGTSSGDESKNSDFGVSSEIFQLRVENEKVHFGVLKRKMSKRRSVTSGSCSEENVKEEFSKFWDANSLLFNNCSVQSVFRVRDRIAFYMKDTRDVYVYSLDSGNLLRAYTLAENLYPLKFRLLMNKGSFFVVWNSEKCRVEFCHLSPEKGFLAIREKPDLLNSYKDTFICVDKQNNLTIYDRLSKLQLEVSHLQHGMFQINDILFETSNVFRMFDYKFMTSLKCIVDLSKTGSANRFWVESFTKFTFPLPGQSTVQYMGVMENMYYIIADGKFFTAGF